MRRIVVTIREDICAENNKTAQQVNELLSILPKYGTVEDFDNCVAKERKEYEDCIANQNSAIEKIKSYGVDENELAVLKALRNAIETSVSEHITYENTLKKALEDNEKSYQDMIKRVREVLPSEEVK